MQRKACYRTVVER